MLEAPHPYPRVGFDLDTAIALVDEAWHQLHTRGDIDLARSHVADARAYLIKVEDTLRTSYEFDDRVAIGVVMGDTRADLGASREPA